jgi:hypothetical protein
MSRKDVEHLVVSLPPTLQDQVLGYTDAVERALPYIVDDYGRPVRASTKDAVIFIAGVRKLYALVSSNYWTLEHSSAMLGEFGARDIRAGGADLSNRGELHRQLREAMAALDGVFQRMELTRYLDGDYVELIDLLEDNGR